MQALDPILLQLSSAAVYTVANVRTATEVLWKQASILTTKKALAVNAVWEEPYLFVGSVERVGVVCLCTHHPGHSADEAHVHAHLEAFVEGVDVAQIASRDDDPVRHLPVKLLANLNGRSLLPL